MEKICSERQQKRDSIRSRTISIFAFFIITRNNRVFTRIDHVNPFESCNWTCTEMDAFQVQCRTSSQGQEFRMVSFLVPPYQRDLHSGCRS
ncbi:hypothetical protein NPIL_41431 [Nephila pilipes]|uniref:Uncharacterized protein n=1 Tax=Nephila pilipes TaxID=299642 RepID=A0A8X6UD37_NEPPI|nr:hypothetical protein NPIL_41431 [Nephila pilipes]